MENWTAENYLAHHGILGMKWGHQNGPPYPLGSGDHSASEKKAGWRKSLDGGSGDSLSRRQRKRLKKQLYKNAKRRIDQEVDEYGRKKEEPREDDDDRPRSKEKKAADLERAEKEGVFREDFLDSIKDTRLYRDRSNENRTKDITKEYEKFLDDPGAYKKRKSEIDDYGRPIKKPSSDAAKSDKAETIKGVASAAATAAGLGIGAKIISDQKKFGTDGSPRVKAEDLSDKRLKELNARAAMESQYNKNYGGKSDVELAQDIVNKSSQGLSSISKKIDDTARSRPEYARMNLEGLSNKDLQDAITRENLEIQYSKLFNKQPQITKGEKRVKDVLDIVGGTLAATATALGIAVAVKELKKKSASGVASAVLHSEIQNG